MAAWYATLTDTQAGLLGMGLGVVALLTVHCVMMIRINRRIKKGR